MIITRTPYRLSFFGGGTDYNAWFEKNGGMVVGSAFSKYCWISVRKLPPFFNYKTRFVYSRTEEVAENIQLIHPGAVSCLKYLQMTDGMEIHHDGDLPAHSGIGSSSSFTVGFLLALYSYQQKMMGKKDLAMTAIEVEQKVEKQNVGIQDQIFASYGGMQIIEMGPGPEFHVSPLILPADYKNHFKSHVLLGFSGFARFATDSARAQIQNIEKGKVESQMKEILGICKEAVQGLTQNCDMKELGRLIHKTWLLKRTLSDSVTNSELDLLYDKAIKAGAYGGRLLGAGQGGFFMFFAPPERHQKIKEALASIKVWVPFEVDEEGSKVILCSED